MLVRTLHGAARIKGAALQELRFSRAADANHRLFLAHDSLLGNEVSGAFDPRRADASGAENRLPRLDGKAVADLSPDHHVTGEIDIPDPQVDVPEDIQDLVDPETVGGDLESAVALRDDPARIPGGVFPWPREGNPLLAECDGIAADGRPHGAILFRHEDGELFALLHERKEGKLLEIDSGALRLFLLLSGHEPLRQDEIGRDLV